MLKIIKDFHENLSEEDFIKIQIDNRKSREKYFNISGYFIAVHEDFINNRF